MFQSNKLIAKFIIIALIFSIFGTNPAPVFAESTSRAAKVTDLSGTVNVQKSGGEKKFSAFKGMSLTQGDSISTGNDSWVELEIDDDKIVKISENTQLGVAELAGSIESGDDQTGLKLWFGKVWTNIKNKLNIRSKYEIRTPKTVMGVRGTQFFVGEEDGKTIVAVLEGRVYSITTRTEQRPDGTVLEKAIEAYINRNEQAVIDQKAPVDTGIIVQPVRLDSLPSTILEEIKNSPQGIDPNLIQNIDQVIEQRRTEETRQEQLQQLQQTPPTEPQISQDPVVSSPAPSPAPSGGGGGSGGVSLPTSIEMNLPTDITIPISNKHTLNISVSPADTSLSASGSFDSSLIQNLNFGGTGSNRTMEFKPSAVGETSITVIASRSGLPDVTKSMTVKIVPYLTVTSTRELVCGPSGFELTNSGLGSSITLNFNSDLTEAGKTAVENAFKSDCSGLATYTWNTPRQLVISNSTGTALFFAVNGSIIGNGIETTDRITFNDFYLIDKRLLLKSVNTMDKDINGKIDHLKLTFNRDVKDNTFYGSQITLTNQGLFNGNIGNLNRSTLANDVTSIDVVNDRILYLSVTEGVYNTDTVGVFNPGSIEMIQDPWGTKLGLVEDIIVTDGACPVPVSYSLNMDVSGNSKSVSIEFSERMTASNIDLSKIYVAQDLSSIPMKANVTGNTGIDFFGKIAAISGMGPTTIKNINNLHPINNADSQYYLLVENSAFCDPTGNTSLAKAYTSPFNFRPDTTGSDLGSVNGTSGYLEVGFADYIDPDTVLISNTSSSGAFTYSINNFNVSTQSVQIYITGGTLSPGAWICFSNGSNAFKDIAGNSLANTVKVRFNGTNWDIIQ